MEGYKIVGLSPSVAGREYVLTDRLLIGRADDNDIIIHAPGVSRHQSEIIAKSDKVTIKDLGSANGTRVNGELIIARDLKAGDRIRIADVEFVFVAPQPETAAPSPSVEPPAAAGEATAFIDMSSVVGGEEPPQAEATSFVDMSQVIGKEGGPPAGEATSFVDMSQVLKGSDAPAPPAAEATSFVDMSEVLGKKGAAEPPAAEATSFVDMSEVLGKKGKAPAPSAPTPPLSPAPKPAAPRTASVPAPSGLAAEKSHFILVYKLGGKEKRFHVPKGSVLVGRDPSCDVAIDDPSVSAKHALFSFDGYSLTVEDAGGASGVFVNLEKVVTARVLRPGDEILLGRISLYCRRDVPEESRIIRIEKKKGGFFRWLLRLFGLGK
ncbi:MAG: hypothetical protein DRP90_01510 [Planctomycetota bacterium]|nr:MAG: hypothetical protein DRP90_01510 [Planctomycetota bacterium]